MSESDLKFPNMNNARFSVCFSAVNVLPKGNETAWDEMKSSATISTFCKLKLLTSIINEASIRKEQKAEKKFVLAFLCRVSNQEIR